MNKKILTRDLVYIAILVALNVICAYVTIPFIIPFTLQTFAIYFSLFFLGGFKGTIVILVYVLLGICGVPVFSNFQAGVGVITGPTGGYIIGFIIGGIIYMVLTKIFKEKIIVKIIASLVSIIACYVIGTIFYSYVYLNGEVESAASVILVCVVPYILPDILKISLALFVANAVQKRLKKSTAVL